MFSKSGPTFFIVYKRDNRLDILKLHAIFMYFRGFDSNKMCAFVMGLAVVTALIRILNICCDQEYEINNLCICRSEG